MNKIVKACKVKGCVQATVSSDLCKRHYNRAWRRWGNAAREAIRDRSGPDLLDMLGPFDRAEEEEAPAAPAIPAKVETDSVADGLRNLITAQSRILDAQRARAEGAEADLKNALALCDDLRATNQGLRDSLHATVATVEDVRHANEQLKNQLEDIVLEEETAPRPLFVRCVDTYKGRPRILLGDSDDRPGEGVRAAAHLIGTWVRLTK